MIVQGIAYISGGEYDSMLIDVKKAPRPLRANISEGLLMEELMLEDDYKEIAKLGECIISFTGKWITKLDADYQEVACLEITTLDVLLTPNEELLIIVAPYISICFGGEILGVSPNLADDWKGVPNKRGVYFTSDVEVKYDRSAEAYMTRATYEEAITCG